MTSVSRGDQAKLAPPDPSRPARPAGSTAYGPLSPGTRRLIALGIEPVYRTGVLVLGSLRFLLGGFVPVTRGWLENRIEDRADLVELLGGIPLRLKRRRDSSDFGPVLARRDAPEIFQEIASLARNLAVRPPDEVRLAYLPCCGLVATGHGGPRALLIGLPLLTVLDRAELRAVLAHELVHLASGDATSMARAVRFVTELSARIARSDLDSKKRRGVLTSWAKSCANLGAWALEPIAEAQEARADRLAASLAGPHAVASALVKVAVVQPLFREVLDHYCSADPGAPNLYAQFRLFWKRLPVTLLTKLRHQALAAPGLPPHPSIADRIGALADARSRSESDDDRLPALALLCDPEATEQMVHDYLFRTQTVEPSTFHRAGS